jgi:hypothetical protein
MTDIHGAGGPAPLNPQDKKMYEQEYKQGVNLFQRAMDEYNKANEIHKKEAFKEVMDRALQVLNETARELKRDDLVDQNSKIAADYQSYRNGNTSIQRQLNEELQKAKRSIS